MHQRKKNFRQVVDEVTTAAERSRKRSLERRRRETRKREFEGGAESGIGKKKEGMRKKICTVEKKCVSLQIISNKTIYNNNLKNKQLCLQESDYSVMVKRINLSIISLLRMVVYLGMVNLSRN